MWCVTVCGCVAVVCSRRGAVVGRRGAQYRPICDRIGSQFRPAVIERHGHCGDGMCSVIKLLSGDGERSAMEDDISFSAPSKTTFVAQHLVYAAVMADAGMVSEFVWHAVHRVPRGTLVIQGSEFIHPSYLGQCGEQ